MKGEITYFGVQPPRVVEQAELQRKADAEAIARLEREREEERQKRVDAECAFLRQQKIWREQEQEARVLRQRDEAEQVSAGKTVTPVSDRTLDRQLAGLTFNTIFRVVGMVLFAVVFWGFVGGILLSLIWYAGQTIASL